MRITAASRSLVITLTLAAACGGSAPDEASRYLTNPAARRQVLERSLVAPGNRYSALRLAHYATGEKGDWDALPELNPPAAPFSTNASTLSPLEIGAGARAGDRAALLALGERAFHRYPVQIASAVERSVTSATDARAFGFWVSPDGGIGGLVQVKTADGASHLAYSCATCHSGWRSGALVDGVACETLDIGALTARAYPASSDAALMAWGPGRLDVTTVEGLEPVRIPDLRPVKELGFLHHTASVAQESVVSLAVRLETLIVTSNGKAIRPPREVALGLALYVWSLDEQLVSRPPSTDAEKRGAAEFETRCARCHMPPSYTGRPVPIDVVGTDPTLGVSKERGTGNYRVPSLRGVSTRGLMFHDGSLSDLESVLDPARLETTFRGRLGKPVLGHRYALDASERQRSDLVAFLKTL